jgi:predicted transposase/invertase (TIGR01784 family)
VPHSVHDALFKATFSQVEHAEGELRVVLPPALVSHIDFSTLTLCPGSFVDEVFQDRHTDLLFSASIAGKSAYLYVLLEHQSTEDALMPFRVLVYIVRIWEAFLKAEPTAKRLPAIIPIVLHHSERGWRVATALEELLDVDADVLAALDDHVPRFRFLLDDLSAQTDDALRARAMSALGRVALWCLRNARSPELLQKHLGRWADLVREVRAAANGAKALEMVLRYIYLVSDRLEVKDLLALVAREVSQEIAEDAVTLGERLIEQGMQTGLQQGMQKGLQVGEKQGRRDMLLRQLRLRFGELPETTVDRVNTADLAQLDRWAERVITSASLADLLQE